MPAFDANSWNHITSGTSISGTHTPVGTPDIITAVLCLGVTKTVTATYGGQSMTLKGSSAASPEVQFFELRNPPSGAQAWSFTWSVNTRGLVSVDSWTQAKGTSLISYQTDSGSGTTSTITGSAANGFLIEGITHSGAGAENSPQSGQTEEADDAQNGTSTAAYRKSSPQATLQINWTTSSAYRHSAMLLPPFAGGQVMWWF